MKQAKNYRKLIKAHLSEFPICVKEVLYKQYVLGSEIIAKGVTEIDGKPVDSNLKYIESVVKPEWIDHEHELLKYCKKYGVKGIMIYAVSLKEHIEKMRGKYPELMGVMRRPGQVVQQLNS